MSGFVIFVLVLTFAYVVYFAVQITLDLHGKKGEKNTEEGGCPLKTWHTSPTNTHIHWQRTLEGAVYSLLQVCSA